MGGTQTMNVMARSTYRSLEACTVFTRSDYFATLRHEAARIRILPPPLSLSLAPAGGECMLYFKAPQGTHMDMDPSLSCWMI